MGADLAALVKEAAALAVQRAFAALEAAEAAARALREQIRVAEEDKDALVASSYRLVDRVRRLEEEAAGAKGQGRQL